MQGLLIANGTHHQMGELAAVTELAWSAHTHGQLFEDCPSVLRLDMVGVAGHLWR